MGGAQWKDCQEEAWGEQPERDSPQPQRASEACQSLVPGSGCDPSAPVAILVACGAWLQHLGPQFDGALPAPRLCHVL